VSDQTARARVAAQLRDLGHEFVGRDLDDAELDEITTRLDTVLNSVRNAPRRTRPFMSSSDGEVTFTVPEYGRDAPRALFSDSVVSGAGNPMGLGAYLWRDGDAAVMEVTLRRAFEGAPDRAHGGIVAALIDETIGLVLAIHGRLALTARLAITYRAATPVDTPLVARAWLEGQDGRKLDLRAQLRDGEKLLVEATALFIEVDPARFRPET
jgi:acyl-coenzyme A thioesterase PaaI-like protein